MKRIKYAWVRRPERAAQVLEEVLGKAPQDLLDWWDLGPPPQVQLPLGALYPRVMESLEALHREGLVEASSGGGSTSPPSRRSLG